MRTMVFVAAFAFAAATPALGHDGRRHSGDDDRPAAAVQEGHDIVSQERALEIAREQGVVTVREIDMDDGRWKVEGRTLEGREIEVEIDPHSGAVLKRELY